MGIDYTLLCLENGEHTPFPRTSQGGQWRDAYYLYEEAPPLIETSEDEQYQGARLLTPGIFDDGRLNASEAEEQKDLRLNRWKEQETWCQQWWARGWRVVMIREQTPAEEYLVYGRGL